MLISTTAKICLFFLYLNVHRTFAKFRVVREWNFVNFTWPDSEIYERNLREKLYLPQNNIIAGLKYFDGFYYVTLPRMKPGVPATLTTIPADFTTHETAPLLTPFPTWEANELNKCESMQNVQNIEIDPVKGQMWIIDGGRTETLTDDPVTRCPPKLILYDLRKMEKVFTYVFPEDVASSNGSFLYDIVVDNTDQGYAYISDNGGRDPGIIVFSMKDHKSWKIRHSQSMRADPNASRFRVNDITISAALNIASLALGPRIRTSNGKIVLNEDREVFYAPLSSLHLYSINSSVLRNEEFGNGEYQGNVKDHGLKSSQGVGMIMDNRGVLYYSLLSVNSIGRWDSSTPFQNGQRIIAKDEKYLEWVNSFAFDDKGNLTILVNKLNRFIYGTLNPEQANFRLITSQIGGKSYLEEESYNYESSSISMETTSSSSPEPNKDVPNMKPGTDQDPYLAPEPKPEPETSVNSTNKRPTTSGASEKSAMALFSLLLSAGLVLIVV